MTQKYVTPAELENPQVRLLIPVQVIGPDGLEDKFLKVEDLLPAIANRSQQTHRMAFAGLNYDELSGKLQVSVPGSVLTLNPTVQPAE